MGDTVGYWPLVVLLIGIAAVSLQIVVFRIQAFIALGRSAILVAMTVTSASTAPVFRFVVLSHPAICIYLAIVAFRTPAFIALVLSAILLAMIVTSGITAALLNSVLPYHSICIYMAIGYGSMTVSWMNDSAFWVVSK